MQPWRPGLPAHCPEASVTRRWVWPVFPEWTLQERHRDRKRLKRAPNQQRRVWMHRRLLPLPEYRQSFQTQQLWLHRRRTNLQRRRAQRSRQRVQSRMLHSRRRALTDIPILVWRMLRAISTSVQRQALMQMSWARCRTTQDVRSSAWKANGHRLSPVPWKVM